METFKNVLHPTTINKSFALQCYRTINVNTYFLYSGSVTNGGSKTVSLQYYYFRFPYLTQ